MGPAKHYDGNPLNNGYNEIVIPNPGVTVRDPVTYPWDPRFFRLKMSQSIEQSYKYIIQRDGTDEKLTVEWMGTGRNTRDELVVFWELLQPRLIVLDAMSREKAMARYLSSNPRFEKALPISFLPVNLVMLSFKPRQGQVVRPGDYVDLGRAIVEPVGE